MKNSIIQVSLFVIAFVALSLLMSYTRPAAEEPKQYMVVHAYSEPEMLAKEVNQKILEGWRPQGGVAQAGGSFTQAMVK